MQIEARTHTHIYSIHIETQTHADNTTRVWHFVCLYYPLYIYIYNVIIYLNKKETFLFEVYLHEASLLLRAQHLITRLDDTIRLTWYLWTSQWLKNYECKQVNGWSKCKSKNRKKNGMEMWKNSNKGRMSVWQKRKEMEKSILNKTHCSVCAWDSKCDNLIHSQTCTAI